MSERVAGATELPCVQVGWLPPHPRRLSVPFGHPAIHWAAWFHARSEAGIGGNRTLR